MRAFPPDDAPLTMVYSERGAAQGVSDTLPAQRSEAERVPCEVCGGEGERALVARRAPVAKPNIIEGPPVKTDRTRSRWGRKGFCAAVRGRA